MKTIYLLLISLFASVSFATDDSVSTADTQFEGIMNAQWQTTLRQNPTFATSLGVREYDQQLANPSLQAYQSAVDEARGFLQQLAELDEASLSREHQLNYALLKLQLENEVEAGKYGGKYLIMNNRSGPHLSLTALVGRLPFFNTGDYQSYLTRLNAMPEYMARATDRIRAGLQAGWVQPCASMQGFEKSIQVHMVDDVQQSTFLEPFKDKPAVIDVKEFTKMKASAADAISNKILPAFSRFNDFYKKEYAPACRAKVGAGSMPGGKEYYNYRVRKFTTTSRSAEEVHKIGLAEVARIRAEMMQVIKDAEFEGDFKAWLAYLRDTPKFYPKTGEERMQVTAAITKKMDGLLPKLFGKLPRMPYGLKEIPLDIAEKTTTAYYNRPAGDGTRAGFYFVNTTLLETRPLYQLEALSLHEAVPGHHLQLALAQELDIPNFRRYGGVTVFVEGWGLYAESLGAEVGFYKTPYTKFGQLSYEMWRACRLVVDTGLHSKGWTRQRAINFMAENSGLSQNNIVSEVDRYISWPGQALAYKTGEMKIRELRNRAEEKLGKQFDVREFHDKILENGALPLSILEKIMGDWLQTKLASL